MFMRKSTHKRLMREERAKSLEFGELSNTHENNFRRARERADLQRAEALHLLYPDIPVLYQRWDGTRQIERVIGIDWTEVHNREAAIKRARQAREDAKALKAHERKLKEV